MFVRKSKNDRKFAPSIGFNIILSECFYVKFHQIDFCTSRDMAKKQLFFRDILADLYVQRERERVARRRESRKGRGGRFIIVN